MQDLFRFLSNLEGINHKLLRICLRSSSISNFAIIPCCRCFIDLLILSNIAGVKQISPSSTGVKVKGSFITPDR
jgi:hypothetical protein